MLQMRAYCRPSCYAKPQPHAGSNMTGNMGSSCILTDSDWERKVTLRSFSARDVFASQTLFKGSKCGNECWTMSKYIMQQAYKMLKMCEIFILVAGEEKGMVC